MKEIKKIRLTDAPEAKKVELIRLEPLCKDKFDLEKNNYDAYSQPGDDLYQKKP